MSSVLWLYTFAEDHTVPFHEEANLHPRDTYVAVEVPARQDPREVMIGYLRQATARFDAPASDLFAEEFCAGFPTDRDSVDRIVMGRTCVGVITVEQTCLACEQPESNCKCLPPEKNPDGADVTGTDDWTVV